MVCSLSLYIQFHKKIKAQHTKIFSVSCAFFSFINHLFINDFCCSVANIIHLLHPQHHIFGFEFFRNLFLLSKQAIVIKTINGIEIGYVPKQDNVIFARLMDAGKLLFGRITSKEKKGSWVKIYIKVFLHE